MHIDIHVAADKNWAIGKDGALLVRIPADMKRFLKETEGKAVLMGRKTLESLPGRQPLGNRVNVVLTRNKNFAMKGVIVVHSVEEALSVLAPYEGKGICCIGGESVYRQLLPYCSRAFVTRIDYSYQADAHFPDLDGNPEWEITDESEEKTYFDLEYTFVTYERR